MSKNDITRVRNSKERNGKFRQNKCKIEFKKVKGKEIMYGKGKRKRSMGKGKEIIYGKGKRDLTGRGPFKFASLGHVDESALHLM